MNTSLEEKKVTYFKNNNSLNIKSQQKRLSELSEQRIDEFLKKDTKR